MEFPELRPHIGSALDIVEGVYKAAVWREATLAADCHVEVPFAIRAKGKEGLPTVVNGVIDLVFRRAEGWRIIDYKTDQVTAVKDLKDRYAGQLEAYVNAWRTVIADPALAGALFFVRTGELVSPVMTEDKT